MGPKNEVVVGNYLLAGFKNYLFAGFVSVGFLLLHSFFNLQTAHAKQWWHIGFFNSSTLPPSQKSTDLACSGIRRTVVHSLILRVCHDLHIWIVSDLWLAKWIWLFCTGLFRCLVQGADKITSRFFITKPKGTILDC